MQTRARFFDDMARVATGAMGMAGGFREEVDGMIRRQLERVLGRMDLVPRDEFDAVREMAARARAEQEALAERVAALEAALAERQEP